MKTVYGSLVLIILAAFSNSAAYGQVALSPKPACADSPRLLEKANEAFEQKRFLIASLLFTRAELEACSRLEKEKSHLGFAHSLFALGEHELAYQEYMAISQGARFSAAARTEAGLQLVFLNRAVPAGSPPTVKDAAKIWGARTSQAMFQAVVAESSLGSAQKIKLSNLKLDYSRAKNPWLAGVASGLVPGLGQAYNGQYQTAALAFVLNGLFLLSTRELVKEKMGFTAAISGLAFSTVYLGNIVSAVQGAKAKNEERLIAGDEILREEIRSISFE